MTMEAGQFVKVCIRSGGLLGPYKIVYGHLEEQREGGRWLVSCQDGKARTLSERVLKRLTPLQVLALEAASWDD